MHAPLFAPRAGVRTGGSLARVSPRAFYANADMMRHSPAALAAMLHPLVRGGGLCAGGLSRSKRLGPSPRTRRYPYHPGRGSQRVSEEAAEAESTPPRPAGAAFRRGGSPEI